MQMLKFTFVWDHDLHRSRWAEERVMTIRWAHLEGEGWRRGRVSVLWFIPLEPRYSKWW